eukprot:7912335-Lingulodinium_polyedra.AAC.1
MSGESLRVFASRAHIAHLARSPTERKPRVGAQYALYTFCNSLREPFSEVIAAGPNWQYIW